MKLEKKIEPVFVSSKMYPCRSWQLMTALQMMNLFEAVIVNNFDYLHADPADLGPQHLHTFTDVWLKYANFHDP